MMTKRHFVISTILFVSVFAVVGMGSLQYRIVRTYEDIAFAISPTAELAFAFGERHFSAHDTDLYDIARAEYFFGKAADIDSTIPYLHHELARIAFLKGDFETAMALIDYQIQRTGDAEPSSYYIRALIEGYKGEYAASARDYEYFLRFRPTNWAATNDYAWVLLKAGRATEAAKATARALEWFPENPWLLNTNATALYEMKEYAAALQAAQKASVAVAKLSQDDWLRAYPGNDPRIADEGIESFKKAIQDNIHSIRERAASSAI
ncbi:hypothetical protein EXS56_02095 [Candidatus Kaiserbacteria bacterium]|nr:hypothetical protein [Candidatus Kaiserbacteria bacterium]